MTLLITLFAAVIFTLIWYIKGKDSKLMLSVPCFIFWGAALMWFVDSFVEFMEVGDEFFNQELPDMLNDSFLGLSAVALGLVIWMAALLIKDPAGRFHAKVSVG